MQDIVYMRCGDIMAHSHAASAIGAACTGPLSMVVHLVAAGLAAANLLVSANRSAVKRSLTASSTCLVVHYVNGTTNGCLGQVQAAQMHTLILSSDLGRMTA
eukprot:GHRR01035293.1.p2 GENE.GHRR01035293.1~~GHRR01035293.1.p2  ORF type:complete len:102 (-),score=27.56 GHRR01035293.1:1299-1604(-)